MRRSRGCAQSSKRSDLSHSGTNLTPRSVALVTDAREGREHTDERLREEQTTMTALLREVIGDVLRRARTDQGRTLREVSDTARVSLGYLSEVERGRKEASSELLSAICGALDIPLSQVLSNAGEEMAREELAAVTRVSATNIDATTKVVIPQVVSMAVA
jgi:transcriptional regulator with XRE-family HTH domain